MCSCVELLLYTDCPGPRCQLYKQCYQVGMCLLCSFVNVYACKRLVNSYCGQLRNADGFWSLFFSFSALMLLVGRHRACKNWVVGCWHGCLGWGVQTCI